MSQTISYRYLESKYVADNHVIANEILSFNISRYVDKLSTGMGITTLFLDHCPKNVIILSPYTSMVEIKQQKDKKKIATFIHGSANGAWGLIDKQIDNNKHVVINATTDGFIKLRENQPEIYHKILNYCHIVADEWHTVFGNTFSKSLPKLYEVILESPLTYVVTTGTSIINHLEIPDGVEIMILDYKVREKKELTIHLCKGEKNEIEKSIVLHIRDCLSKGLKPAIATNNKKYLKVCPELTKELLAGEAMKAKTKLVTKVEEVTNINNADVAFFSTKYVPGADFDGKVSVHTIADGSFKADSKTTQEIFQAPGRPRIGYINTKLTYKPSDGHRCEKVIISEIEQFDRAKPTYAADTKELFYELMMSQTYGDFEVFLEKFTYYGVDVTVVDEDEDYIGIDESSTLATSLTNLMKNNEQNIQRSYIHVLNNIQGDAYDTNLYTENIVTVYVIWKLVSLGLVDVDKLKADEDIGQQCRSIPFILDNATSCDDEVKKCLDWLRVVNSKKDIKAILKKKTVQSDKNEENVRSWVLLKSTLNNIFKTAFENKLKSIGINVIKHLKTYGDKTVNHGLEDALQRDVNLTFSEFTTNVHTNFKNKLQEFNIPDNQSATDLFLKVNDEVKKAVQSKTLNELNYILNGNRERYIKQFVDLGKFIFCLKYDLYFTGFKLTRSSNREYNPVVKVPKVLKRLTPIPFNEFDIISANPMIIDLLVGSNIGQNMYQSLMTKYGITRDQAKTKYNTAINNHKDKSRYKTMKSLGYDDSQANYLADLGKVKGKVYKETTAIEERLVDDLAHANFLNTYARSHDGLICFEDLTKLNLPNDVNFEKTHFSVR
jgi:hypothetical protein